MKILIIPEDQTQDGYIVRPIVEALCADLGVSARVDVLPEPRLRGAGDALDKEIVAGIVRDNPMTDLFLLVADRDCDRRTHSAKAAEREKEHPRKLMACLAIEEVEVWMLALHREDLGARWSAVRSHCDPKEEWAEQLLQSLGRGGPGGGRKRAMQALRGQLQTLLSLCDELQELRRRLAATR